jgi:glycerophosphoryl diester phosphodiesterase
MGCQPAAAAVDGPATPNAEPQWAARPGGFDLQGHRGARGLAPENTLHAFAVALSVGVSTLELDVGITADGVVVVHHDRAINPALTRGADGRWLQAPAPLLRTLDFSDLRQLDVGRIDPASSYARNFTQQQPQDGARIPTLRSVFEHVRNIGAQHVRFNIETKLSPLAPDETVAPQRFAQAVLAEVQAAGMTARVSIQSFDWRSLRAVQQLAPEVPTVCLTAQAPRFDTLGDGAWTAGLRRADYPSVPHLVQAAGCKAWSPRAADLTQADVANGHALGLRVLPWTVNQADEMDRLIAWGVDGLITDHPERGRDRMQAAGLALPPRVEAPPARLPAPGR